MKKILLFSFMLTGVVFLLASSTQTQEIVYAQSELACDALNTGAGSCGPGDGETEANSLIKISVNVLSVVAGIIAVFMLIIGGLRYITSNGDSGSLTSARNTIIYAIIGLVIVAISQVFVQFVVGSLGQPDPQPAGSAEVEEP